MGAFVVPFAKICESTEKLADRVKKGTLGLDGIIIDYGVADLERQSSKHSSWTILPTKEPEGPRKGREETSGDKFERAGHTLYQVQRVSVDNVLNIYGFDLKRTLDMDPEFLNTDGLSKMDSENLDMELLHGGIGDILQNKGADILLHESSMFDEVEMDPNEKRESKLVFIGKNLDAEELREAFKLCMHTPELEQVRLEQLRFDVGDSVECNVGGERIHAAWFNGRDIRD
ncbi:unnamed protein product [Bathycoccus prasinos]